MKSLIHKIGSSLIVCSSIFLIGCGLESTGSGSGGGTSTSFVLGSTAWKFEADEGFGGIKKLLIGDFFQDGNLYPDLVLLSEAGALPIQNALPTNSSWVTSYSQIPLTVGRTYLFGLGFNVNLDSTNLEDLVLYSQSANQFQILTNTGSGSFLSSGTQPYSSNISWMSAAAYKERSSVNNKWHLLAVSDSTKPALFQMTGSAFSAVPFDTTLTAAIRSLTADFNSDGFEDFLIIPKFSGVAPLILKNDSDVSFQQLEMTRTASATISEAATGDFNGDGKLDILLATSEGFEIHINASPDSDTIVFQEVISQFDPNVTNVIWMAVGEVTGDGVLDVMVARNNSAPVVFAGLGNYQFSDFTNLAFGNQLNQCFTGSSASSIKQVYFSSIRKNGKNDVIVANDVGDLCVLFNQGS